jgi:pyridine nucleotide-disulfide oxidoreductase family protein
MRRLMLVGGGQAHAVVLRTLAAAPRNGVEVVLLTPAERLLYSGMLPGWIAGHYARGELTVDLAPLAQAAGAVLLPRRVVALDLVRKTVLTDRGESVEFDLLSIASGATVDFDAIPGSRDHALPVRPLENFAEGWERILAFAAAADAPLRISVIGAGAAGVEIALAMRHRLRERREQVGVQLVTGDMPIVPGHGARARALLGAALLRHGVRLVEGMVRQLDADAALLEDDAALPTDVTLLVTGPAAEAWPRAAGLATDERGFVEVDAHLRSTSHPFVFAAGDAATLVDTPRARSGVYALRAATPLAANLLAALDGRPLVQHRPPERALYLIGTGPRHAVASWGRWAASGEWAWRWKERIDRGFIAQLQSV